MQADSELRERLEQISGDGGAAGIEYEDGKPTAMKRSVRNNMFRLKKLQNNPMQRRYGWSLNPVGKSTRRAKDLQILELAELPRVIIQRHSEDAEHSSLRYLDGAAQAT
ncbi:uncharacterized protein N7483_010789 [Penicillium malachiteum]|uniref:uncharacterized protein n=1 Tax=Penicillium malachiteum TaxID=1324776 RepID=UPI002547FBB6|nr:uncharacterized protein N7483_010789 [Penicillium malachiteum]KAJ5713608.1 hypothetical protein N7483_010789 [Penicillium malachiteum]